MSSSAERRKRFLGVFPVIRKQLVEYISKQGLVEDACKWFERSLDYNTPGGKLNRGLSVPDSVEILRGKPLTDEEYEKAAVLGWCVELLQADFLVADDIMDQSVTRRDQPCWYRVPGVGNIAINDSFMLEMSIYHLIKRYYRSDPSYVDIIETFHDVSFKTEMGQLVDLITAPEDKVDLSKFSLERHSQIVVFKTAWYSFYLPVALAMYACGISDEKSHELAQSILIPLGEYFQVQDDYLDAFGKPEDIGKIGTDILDNKCSWCVNIALQVCTPKQREILDSCYGRKDAAKEKRVKELYEQIGLRERYAKYEEEAYRRIMGLIETVPETSVSDRKITLKRQVFKVFLDKIYKRIK